MLLNYLALLNYSPKLKHFLKVRNELKARQWGNILHKYGIGLALDIILEVETSIHFIIYKDVVLSWEGYWY